MTNNQHYVTCERHKYLASTSVETRPGSCFRSSTPKRTNSLSIALSICSSTDLENHSKENSLFIQCELQQMFLKRKCH